MNMYVTCSMYEKFGNFWKVEGLVNRFKGIGNSHKKVSQKWLPADPDSGFQRVEHFQIFMFLANYPYLWY
jgi:hypothetical protein